MKCDVCGKTKEESRIINSKLFNKILCSRHYVQMQTHGCIKEHTVRDSNEIITNKDYSEVVIIKNEIKHYVKVDNGCVDIVGKHRWYISDSGYAMTTINGKNIRMHKLILNDFENEIDHENRDKIDNRKHNLRKSTHIDNSTNNPVRKNNKTGTIGISFDKQTQKWKSSITVNFKTYNLGRYIDIEDAILARLNAELKYFNKEYAPQRHLFEKYNIK